MKLVYAVDKLSFNDKDHIGVVKKVESQMKLFNDNGIDSAMCQYTWEAGYPQIEISEDTDLLYFRRIEPSAKLIIKLRELKKINKHLRVIMEIPTYPFKAEERGHISIKRRVSRLIGEMLMRFCIDRIVLIGQEKEIPKLYGIPAICVNNGTDYGSISVRKADLVPKDEIHMICVSGCFFWHGYDRIIEGIHQYYLKKEHMQKVYLHVVGEGECLEEYKAAAEKYKIKDKYVFFYGRKVGKELDAIYDKSNIALDCLGTHRKNMFAASSLKAREYAAKGLPIATSLRLDIQNEHTGKYICQLPVDDEAIDVEEIVKFYHRMYDDKKACDVADKIRNDFYLYCDWQFVFQDVVKYMKG